VVHVSQPTVAGVPHVIEALVRDQVERGWRVHVACPADGYLADRVSLTGAHVHRWEATRGPAPSVLGEVRRLQRVLHEVDPSVVHLHSSKAGLAGRLAVRGRTPTVFQPHSWSFLAVAGPMRRATLAWERWADRWTAALVCVSDDEARQGRAAGIRSEVHVIPNGIDVPDDVVAVPSDARAALVVPEGPTAVCLGRLARQKGQDRLLRIWPEILRAVPEARLVLVGEGPDRTRLETIAARTSGVSLVGHHDDVFPWLAIGDVVVLPSRWEAGLTLAAMEAMAAGRSVVAADFAGVAATLPADAGQVVAQDDDVALREAVVRRLTDRDLAHLEGASGRRFVTTSCSLVTAGAAVRALYAELTGASA
jgi:glycosyltransferase involved in cell wall biosynthesis